MNMARAHDFVQEGKRSVAAGERDSVPEGRRLLEMQPGSPEPNAPFKVNEGEFLISNPSSLFNFLP